MKTLLHWIPCSLALFLSSASIARAQIPAGSGVVTTRDIFGGFQALWSVPLVAGGGGTPITPISAGLASRLFVADIDPTSGDLIVGAQPPGTGMDSELHRLVLSGTTVTSEALLATLPGTTGGLADVYREPSGCMLTLCFDANGAPVVHRVSVTPVQAMVTLIPLLGGPNSTAPYAGAITSAPDGSLFIGLHQGNVGTVVQYGPDGGLPLATTAVNHRVNHLDLDAAGGIVSVGDPSGTPPTNFFCGGVDSYVTPVFFNFGAGLEVLPSGDFVFGWNGSGGSSLDLLTMSGCTVLARTQIFQPPGGTGIYDVARRVESKGYGCPCIESTGTMPVISEVSPPILGGVWQLDLDSSQAGQPATLFLGSNNLAFGASPLPLAIGGGCGLLSSGDILRPVLTTNAFGDASFQITIPNDPTLIGLDLYCQWVFGDPGTTGNPFLVGMTAGIRTTIQ